MVHFPFMTPTVFVSPEISGETFLMNAFFGSKLHTRIPHWEQEQPKISARSPPNTGATNLIFSVNKIHQAGQHDGPRTSKIQAVS